MRARDAENLMADILTRANKDAGSETRISEADLLGMRRSQPIYERKLKERENIKQRQRRLFFIQLFSRITYPFVVLLRILRK